MSIQVQASQNRSLHVHSKPSFLKERIFHDDIMVTIGSQRQAIQLLKSASAQEKKDKMVLTIDDLLEKEDTHPKLLDCSAVREEESYCLDLILFRDESSTVSSDISVASRAELEDEVWDLREYPNAVTDYRPYSWTIHIYNQKHLRRDTVWFRVSCNGTTDYRELEDTEILEFVATVIDRNPFSCFYLKTRSSDDVSFFKSYRILRTLKALLERAQLQDGIEIPSKSSLRRKQIPEPEKKAKNGFFSWFFRV